MSEHVRVTPAFELTKSTVFAFTVDMYQVKCVLICEGIESPESPPLVTIPTRSGHHSSQLITILITNKTVGARAPTP